MTFPWAMMFSFAFVSSSLLRKDLILRALFLCVFIVHFIFFFCRTALISERNNNKALPSCFEILEFCYLFFWFRDHHTTTFRHFFTDVNHSTSIFPSLQWCQISLTSQCLHRGVATVVKDSCAGRPVSKTLLQKIRWIRSRRRRKMLLSWCRPEGNAFV